MKKKKMNDFEVVEKICEEILPNLVVSEAENVQETNVNAD